MTGQGSRDKIMTEEQWKALIDRFLAERFSRTGGAPVGRVLLLPPDITRCYSFGGAITAYLYQRLAGACQVFVMPAVGTHMQMSREELEAFFPGIPYSAFLTHDWREDNVSLGMVPGSLVRRISGGSYDVDIEAVLDRRLVSGEFDTILSIGQVVPHEVAGMANYTKNLLVGLGGRDMINHSHMLGAICGIERILGNVDCPVRELFDYVQREFVDRLGIVFFLTVAREQGGRGALYGLYIGEGRDTFEEAASLASQVNITWLTRRQARIVAWLDPAEFRTAWVGNKAIYRTRLAVADGGELVILAPGVSGFGENEEVDRCIRRYGYSGTERILGLYRQGAFRGLEMVAAHLIHGSTDGRFCIIYATDPALLAREAVERAGFGWMDVRAALEKYRLEEKETGIYREAGEEYYLVKSPSVGLWKVDRE